MIIEIPTDDGSTRMLAYINDLNKTATKIGAIAPTRNYISNMVKYFGGMLISNGKDDVIEYSYHDTKSACTDLSEHKGYYYSEYGRYVYTNANLIEALASTSGISLGAMGTPTMPFRFNDFGSDPLKLGELAGLPRNCSGRSKLPQNKQQKNSVRRTLSDAVLFFMDQSRGSGMY